jgi:methyl-accepting chemotaxis protein
VREVARVAEHTQGRAEEAAVLVGNAQGVVGGLAVVADDIGGIVELIEDIAEQTNLLALNATVEAARAGDAGRGFAVVAGEVKDLARATTVATERIRTSILAVQAGSTSAAEAISQIVGTIDQIREGQLTVAAAVDEEIAAASEIERSVARQTSGIIDIRASIGSIDASVEGVKVAAASVASTALRAAAAGAEMAETARNNVGSANSTGASAEALTATAIALQAAVDKFAFSAQR